MNLIETIRIVLYYLIYIGITSFILLLLISSSIQDFRELRAWAKEEEEEGGRGRTPRENKSLKPVKGGHS